MPLIPKEVIVFPMKKGKWAITNLLSRTHLGVDSIGLNLLMEAESLNSDEISEKFAESKFLAWEISYFSNYQCLMDDPSRLNQDESHWPEPEQLNVAEMIKRLKKESLLFESEKEYLEAIEPNFSADDSLFAMDPRERINNEVREIDPDPPNYWTNQKFTKDRLNIKDNMYKAVQEFFLEKYFSETFNENHTVIDLGCGTGHYANMMARTGASVIGADPNPNLIEIARRNADSKTRFEIANVGQTDALNWIESYSADYVFMSDSLLFYYKQADFPADLKILLSDIRRILKKDGRFICCEPHHLFLFAPWFGGSNRPFTVITEYMSGNMKINPPISWHIQSMAKNGFAITWMEELMPNPDLLEKNPKAYNFASQFPLWMFYEMKQI